MFSPEADIVHAHRATGSDVTNCQSTAKYRASASARCLFGEMVKPLFSAASNAAAGQSQLDRKSSDKVVGVQPFNCEGRLRQNSRCLIVHGERRYSSLLPNLEQPFLVVDSARPKRARALPRRRSCAARSRTVERPAASKSLREILCSFSASGSQTVRQIPMRRRLDQMAFGTDFSATPPLQLPSRSRSASRRCRTPRNRRTRVTLLRLQVSSSGILWLRTARPMAPSQAAKRSARLLAPRLLVRALAIENAGAIIPH